MIPAATVACPRRVLSMSMDVSSGRTAVAALLEGRMGMVSELRYGCRPGTENSGESHVECQGYVTRKTTTASTSAECEVDACLDCTDRALGSQGGPHLADIDADQTPIESIDVKSMDQAISLLEVNDRRTYMQSHINRTWNLNLQGPRQGFSPGVDSRPTSPYCQSLPVESSTSSFYRHLCSEDDPPRSVSICPQRRCVAFGCSAGIELHWTDALTGQSLSR